MFKKVSFVVLTTLLGVLPILSFSYGAEGSSTVDKFGTQTTFTPLNSKKMKSVGKKPSPYEGVESLNEENFKKISNTLCTKGFKAYVGTDKKNVCQSQMSTSDIVYSCVWDNRGIVTYASTVQGPCSLDFAVHSGSILVTKDNTSSIPLSYGQEARSFYPTSTNQVEAQCCMRATAVSVNSN